MRDAARRDDATIRGLAARAVRDGAEIEALHEGVSESARIERAQHALIAQLRVDAGSAGHEIADIGDRLRAAEAELVDLRAIRDALIEPALIQRAGMTVAAEIITSDTYVGGDFFFVGDGPAGTIVLAIGDVVGKGLAAARRSAFTRTALASVAPFSDDPSRLLRWVNVALVERIGESAEFVTAACVTYDPQTRTLRYAAAGHHSAHRLDTGAEITSPRHGVALGLSTDLACDSHQETLRPGAGVLMFTDGLIEAGDRHDRFGINRVQNLLKTSPGLAPELTIARLKDALHAHAGGDVDDDVGFLAMRTH